MSSIMNRGEFLHSACAAAAVGSSGRLLAEPARVGVVPTADVKIRSALLHLGMSMWGGYLAPGGKEGAESHVRPHGVPDRFRRVA